MRLCEAALEQGVFAQAIRPPTVPAGNLEAASGGDGLATRPRSCARPRASSARRRASWDSSLADDGRRERREPRRATSREPERADRSAPASQRRTPPHEHLARRARRSTSSATAASARPAACAAAGARACAGCSSPPPTPASARRVLSAALLAAMRAAGEPVRALQAGRDGARGRAGDQRPCWPPDHELLASVAGMTPERGRAAALRPRRLAPSRGCARRRARRSRGR